MAHDLSNAELQTYEALYKNQGARIMFHCDQVTYQGIISLILPETCRVKLRHVKILEGGQYFRNLRFHFKDLASFTVVESAEAVNRYPRNEYLMNILRNHRPVKSDVCIKALYEDKLSDQSEDETPEETTKEENFVLDLPKHLEHKLPKNYAVVDTINEDFYQAIQCISNQQLIGVSFHGPLISRFGKLTWICISTDVYLFLFDIENLGKEAFDKGLRQLLENQSVKKIIHDCSYPSDCLARCYNTRLTNVFDTRVADYVVHVQRYNDKHEFHPFKTLDSCLRIYLKVPQDFLFKRETFQSSSSRKCVSSKRPITNDCLYDLSKSVVYLKLLQEQLSKELLTPLYRATDFYRAVLAKSNQQVIDLLGNVLSRPDRMIQSLLMYGIQTARFEKPQYKNIPLSCTFINPQNGEVIRSNLGLPAAMTNDSTRRNVSVLPNKERVLNEAHTQLTNFKTDKVIRPYLGSPAAVKSALIQSIEKSKQASMVEKVNNCEATSLSAKSSFMHINKIYYPTSISEMYPGRLKNIENLKPIDYISKFSDKQPLSSCFDTTLNSSVENTGRDCDASSVVNSSCSNKEPDESSDIWSKLRSEFLAERPASFAHCSERKISFMPG